MVLGVSPYFLAPPRFAFAFDEALKQPKVRLVIKKSKKAEVLIYFAGHYRHSAVRTLITFLKMDIFA